MIYRGGRCRFDERRSQWGATNSTKIVYTPRESRTSLEDVEDDAVPWTIRHAGKKKKKKIPNGPADGLESPPSNSVLYLP